VSAADCICFSSFLDPTAQAHQESYDSDDQEYNEQYFSDAGGAGGNSAETEERGNQGDNEEDCGIVKHFSTSYLQGRGSAVWREYGESGLLKAVGGALPQT
jgi:hypothetical protein